MGSLALSKEGLFLLSVATVRIVSTLRATVMTWNTGGVHPTNGAGGSNEGSGRPTTLSRVRGHV
jgi:hypothetical protein